MTPRVKAGKVKFVKIAKRGILETGNHGVFYRFADRIGLSADSRQKTADRRQKSADSRHESADRHANSLSTTKTSSQECQFALAIS